MFGLLIIVALVAVFAVAARRCLKVIKEGQVAVVLRLGRFDRVVKPGLRFIPPRIDEFFIVETSPRRFKVPAAGYTRDGIRVTLDVALVARVTQPVLALRHSGSLQSQAHDTTANVIVSEIGRLTFGELALGADALLARAQPRLDEALGAIGLGADSLRAGEVGLPRDLSGALASVTVAAHQRRGDLVLAQTARLVTDIEAHATAERLTHIDEVARRLDPRTLELERFAVVRAAAESGGQINVFTGLDDSELRTAMPLPPPRLRKAS